MRWQRNWALSWPVPSWNLRERQAEQQRLEEERQTQERQRAQGQPRMSQLESDVNRDGSDYKDFVAAGVNECLEACGSDAQCEAIAFTKSSRQCWMKSAVPLRQSDARYTSAVKVGG